MDSSQIPPIQASDYQLQPKVPASTPSGLPGLGIVQDYPQNRRGFKYLSCFVNPELFPNVKYTCVEAPPYHAHLSVFDRSMSVALDTDESQCKAGSTDGFTSVRAEVGMRHGRYFWEVRVIKANEDGSQAHVRLGVARREAALQAPVGYDAYGYGIRDVKGMKVHLSRPAKFMDDGFGSGDVMGFYLELPENGEKEGREVLRDRVPIRYKGGMYFECLEYEPEKELEDMIVPLSTTTKRKRDAEIEKLPGSVLRVYKNGKLMGDAFTDLNSFWPPNSRLHQIGKNAEELIADDGMLGYFPMVSLYKGGTVEVNFGPEFDFIPEDLKESLENGDITPVQQRYDEQIAEDVVYDILQEVNLSGKKVQ